ncbi:unannotated protein [freshwater metagenome]|uniref:Unannotated protein n=1 Tax=freshwater metagenome TaxID=449393 RepID=A0A6J7W4Q3_9ZZZZ|nr:phosphotransferase [Actinomycetota bacterium]
MGGTPIVLGDINKTWLSDVLGVRVTDLSMQVIGAGEGFMGQLARVSLQGDNVPASVIVKLPTSDPGGQVMGEMMGVWKREHRFYTELASRMKGITLATCLYSTAEPYALILEDLSPARAGDQVAGPTPAQARTAIDVAATLHSNWFDKPELEEFDWMPRLDDPMTASIGTMFPIGWPIFLERYQDSLPPRVLAWCEKFVPMIETWMKTYADWPCTLTHGDFRLDNMFFSENGSMTLIDWQLSMRTPSTTDLVYFLGTNIPTAMRREMQDELIIRYCNAMRDGGVPDEWADYDRIVQGYAEGMLFYCTSFAASILSLDPANERGAALMDSLVRRAFSAADDLDAGSRLGI